MTIAPKIIELSNGTDLIEDWSPECTRLFYVEITIVLRFEQEDLNLYYLDITTPEFLLEEKMPKFVKIY